MYNPTKPDIHRRVLPKKCYKCEKRHVGCHSHCKDYHNFREQLEQEKRAAFEANAPQCVASSYEVGVRAEKKYRGQKWGQK